MLTRGERGGGREGGREGERILLIIIKSDTTFIDDCISSRKSFRSLGVMSSVNISSRLINCVLLT